MEQRGLILGIGVLVALLIGVGSAVGYHLIEDNQMAVPQPTPSPQETPLEAPLPSPGAATPTPSPSPAATPSPSPLPSAAEAKPVPTRRAAAAQLRGSTTSLSRPA